VLGTLEETSVCLAISLFTFFIQFHQRQPIIAQIRFIRVERIFFASHYWQAGSEHCQPGAVQWTLATMRLQNKGSMLSCPIGRSE